MSSVKCYSCNGVMDISMCSTSTCDTKCFLSTSVTDELTTTARGCFESEADFEGKCLELRGVHDLIGCECLEL